MKKALVSSLLAAATSMMLAVSPAGAVTKAKEDVSIQINNVEVKGKGNHHTPGKLYVDAIAYAELLGAKYTYDKTKKTFTVNNKSLPVKVYNNQPSVHIRAIAAATGAEEVYWDQSGKRWTLRVLDLPEGAVKYHPVIPGMGQHWVVASKEAVANETLDFRKTTIYGSYKGKLIFIEQMIDQEYFKNPEKYGNLQLDGMKGLPAPAIQHTDIEFQAVGHPGFEVPHFDIHHYYVSHEEHLAITGEDKH